MNAVFEYYYIMFCKLQNITLVLNVLMALWVGVVIMLLLFEAIWLYFTFISLLIVIQFTRHEWSVGLLCCYMLWGYNNFMAPWITLLFTSGYLSRESSIVIGQSRLYPPRTEFHFFEIVLWNTTSLSFCDEGFGTRYGQSGRCCLHYIWSGSIKWIDKVDR